VVVVVVVPSDAPPPPPPPPPPPLHSVEYVSTEPTGGRFAGFSDRQPTTPACNFRSYYSTWRGCPRKWGRVSFGGLVSFSARLLILIAALKFRFTNSIRFLALVGITDASRPRTRNLYATRCSGSAPYFAISSGLRWHFSISAL
jgi:hypothetical protein